MKTNQLHINLSKCAHMYFRPNLHYKECLSCARTTGYDQGFSFRGVRRVFERGRRGVGTKRRLRGCRERSDLRQWPGAQPPEKI